VAPLFHYVEKGDENDGDVSCSVTATLFFFALSSRKQNFVAKISRNFVYFAKRNFAKFREINIKISPNTKGILSRNFVSRNFIDHPTANQFHSHKKCAVQFLAPPAISVNRTL
jgi:hypothetical protein